MVEGTQFVLESSMAELEEPLTPEEEACLDRIENHLREMHSIQIGQNTRDTRKTEQDSWCKNSRNLNFSLIHELEKGIGGTIETTRCSGRQGIDPQQRRQRG